MTSCIVSDYSDSDAFRQFLLIIQPEYQSTEVLSVNTNSSAKSQMEPSDKDMPVGVRRDDRFAKGTIEDGAFPQKACSLAGGPSHRIRRGHAIGHFQRLPTASIPNTASSSDSTLPEPGLQCKSIRARRVIGAKLREWKIGTQIDTWGTGGPGEEPSFARRALGDLALQNLKAGCDFFR
jgi:hypothetical protein